jgi:hypothetical protein
MATVFARGISSSLGVPPNISERTKDWTPIVFADDETTTPKIFKSVHMSPSFGYQIVLHTT